ncbi:MAG: RtcB family protein [Candidatus Sumerlaeia bacterium]
MKTKKLLKHGWQGRWLQLAKNAGEQLHRVRPELNKRERLGLLDAVRSNPSLFLNDPVLEPLARALMQDRQTAGAAGPANGTPSRKTPDAAPGTSPSPMPPLSVELMPQPAPYRIWGREDIDPAALEQMDVAARLPVACRGALMPDAHVGYGLPIGGVLGLYGAVCPYAVGVDIACRMRLTLVDAPPDQTLEPGRREHLCRALLSQTRFGVGAEFEHPHTHDVMDDPDWNAVPWIREQLKDTAWRQLGTSGAGNHFVEFGVLELTDGSDLGLEPGNYLALMSHSGSRQLGARICEHYSRLARDRCRLPSVARHLAYLPLETQEGQEYWIAMNLAGRYAAANHEIIHRRVLGALGFTPVAHVENHHNFAWRETHEGREIIVHRKGATPAARGLLGVIPGSMADPGYLVRGLGDPASLLSAAHGAGRALGRKEARRRISHAERDALLKERGVLLLGGGLDESPQAYKSIHAVMASQRDLVQPIGEFRPKIVLMADD